jgi:glutamate synthase (NADPH/NADH) small chain
VKGVFAGGDCVTSGIDLTVQSVADGRDAAISIDAYLRGEG